MQRIPHEAHERLGRGQAHVCAVPAPRRIGDDRRHPEGLKHLKERRARTLIPEPAPVTDLDGERQLVSPLLEEGRQ